MLSPFDVWAPMFRAPFSGDVTQEIVPRYFSPEIAGNAEVERRVHSDVASYGKQLGKVLEALQALSTATGTALPEIDGLVSRIDAVKADCKTHFRAEAEAALERLRAVDEEGWRAVTQKD